jgi:hypothetical protein
MGNSCTLVVYSNRDLQRQLDEQIRSAYPGVEPLVYVRKAADIAQITTIALDTTSLVVNIVTLALQIRGGQPKEAKSEITIEIEYGNRKLKIDAVEHEADIAKIIEDFLNAGRPTDKGKEVA